MDRDGPISSVKLYSQSSNGSKSSSGKAIVLRLVLLVREFNIKQSNHDLSATNQVRACLHGGGGPQVGEVTRLGGVTRLSI